MILGRERALPMERSLLAYSTDPAHPIVVYGFVFGREGLIRNFGNRFLRSGSCRARGSRDCVVAPDDVGGRRRDGGNWRIGSLCGHCRRAATSERVTRDRMDFDCHVPTYRLY